MKIQTCFQQERSFSNVMAGDAKRAIGDLGWHSDTIFISHLDLNPTVMKMPMGMETAESPAGINVQNLV